MNGSSSVHGNRQIGVAVYFGTSATMNGSSSVRGNQGGYGGGTESAYLRRLHDDRWPGGPRVEQEGQPVSPRQAMIRITRIRIDYLRSHDGRRRQEAGHAESPGGLPFGW